jgi:hypothetical protein
MEAAREAAMDAATGTATGATAVPGTDPSGVAAPARPVEHIGPVAPATVLVAVPLIGRDAGLVAEWAQAVEAVARAHPAFVFLKYAAVRAGDAEAARACARAGVGVVEVPWYHVARDQRQNPTGIVVKRIRLVREALRVRAAVIWFVDVDVRVRPELWTAADALFQTGTPVAVVPYPLRWAAGAPLVGVRVGDEVILADARRICSESGLSSALIVGGGFGCTAILVWVAALISFTVPSLSLLSGGFAARKDLGWFVNAAQARVEVRMPLGLVAEHVGCAPAPTPGPPPAPTPGPPPAPTPGPPLTPAPAPAPTSGPDSSPTASGR